MVVGARPVSLNVVVFPLEKKFVSVEFENPPNERLPLACSISYPVTGEPPLLAGTAHDRCI